MILVKPLHILLMGLLLSSPLIAEPGGLSDVPFWKLSEGLWASDNTYLNPKMEYNLKAYNSIVRIELNGVNYIETEYKFYPPGRMAAAFAQGKLPETSGIETVTVIKGQMLDNSGDLMIESIQPSFGNAFVTHIDVLNEDTAYRVSRRAEVQEGDSDSYRMLLMYPDKDRRYVANFGLFDRSDEARHVGDLRGFSLFRGHRISASEFDEVRQTFRAMNSVKGVAEPNAEGKVEVHILD